MDLRFNQPPKKLYTVAVVGATGAVGKEFIELFERYAFPIKELKLFASPTSRGKKIVCQNREWTVTTLDDQAFVGVDLAFFSAGANFSQVYVPQAVSKGAVVVDNSSAFRMDETVPLVVPEVNKADLQHHQGIIANPNCSTIQMVLSLMPLQQLSPIEEVRVATYQAVSGSGFRAMDELIEQTHDFSQGHNLKNKVYPAQILFNLIPHVDVFLDNDYTKEEMKMVLETQKIFHNPKLKVSATCVRVPVLRSHSEVLWVKTKNKIGVQQAKDSWQNTPGIKLIDGKKPGHYPMPHYTTGKTEVFIGRVREDLVDNNSLTYWCVSDQLLKGAAWNSLQIGAAVFDIALTTQASP